MRVKIVDRPPQGARTFEGLAEQLTPADVETFREILWLRQRGCPPAHYGLRSDRAVPRASFRTHRAKPEAGCLPTERVRPNYEELGAVRHEALAGRRDDRLGDAGKALPSKENLAAAGVAAE